MHTVYIPPRRATAWTAFWAWTEDFAKAYWRAVVRRNDHRVAVRHLRSLSDSHLQDIGIHRSEITSAVYGINVDWSRRRNTLV